MTPSNERRLTHRVYMYWQQLCNGSTMPKESDIDPEALGTDWEYCFMLQARDVAEIDQFNFTYLGEGINRAYAETALDPDNMFLVGPKAYCLAPHFIHVLTTGKPLLDDSHFIGDSGKKVLYRQCLLPIGDAQEHVVGVFGAMYFKCVD